MPSAQFRTFQDHVRARGHELNEAQWQDAERLFAPVALKRGSVLLDSAVIADDLFFVCDGVAASVQTSCDGDTQIARFFERGQLCSNITSAWQRTVSEDELIAMTDLCALRVPITAFRSAYLHGGPLSGFWREMVFETLLFDKDVLCTKTLRDVGTRYRFLAERYDNVVGQVADRHLARFLGITPQGLSRYLRHRREELTQANTGPARL